MQPRIVQSLSFTYCLLVNVGAKHSLTVIKIKVRLCLDACLSEPCHRLARPRLFQPPRSRTKPTLPDLACSCIGVSQSQPSTYRIALSKRKNPMMFWWGKSRWHGQSVSSPRVFRVSSAVVTHPRHFFHAPPKNHGVNCSWLTIRLPHLTVWIIHGSVKL